MTPPAFDLDAMKTRAPGRFSITAPVRFADLDPNDHVNHANYLAYLEECRLAFRRDVEASAGGFGGSYAWPIAELTIRYLRPLPYPGEVTVELAALGLGRTSFTLGYGIHGATYCAAVALTRSVCVDVASGQPAPLPAALAERLRCQALRV